MKADYPKHWTASTAKALERRMKEMAIPDSGGVRREQTLKTVITECEKGQAEIIQQLTKNFDRVPKKESNAAEILSYPNVLDEFIARLTALNIAQKGTIQFLIEQVNSKL